MNKIFDKNINALKDSGLKKILETYDYKIKPVLASTNGYNIYYDGIYLHNEESPLAESKEIFKCSGNTPNTIHLIYGLGLGYLLQIASLDSKGIVVVFEPNLDILHNSFTLVDFSGDLSKSNVFLFTDFKKLVEFITETSTNDSSVEILSLPGYRALCKDVFNEQTKQLELAFGSIILDYGYKRRKLFSATFNTLYNIPQLIKETPVNTLENFYQGKTAIIVSAGPTLFENIETLKKYQDKAVIFSVGPALKTLVKNGIKTDYLCIVESYNCSKQVEGLDLSDMALVLEPFTNPAIHALDVKKRFLHVSDNMPPSQYWGKISGINTKGYMTQGTVSYMALNTAVKMGFSKIILVGQDLAYIEGQCYSKDSAYEGLVCKFNPDTKKYEISPLDFEKYANSISASQDLKKREAAALKRLAGLNASLYTVKSINGNTVPTEAGYAAFIKHFADYASILDGIKLINTSLKGAQIDGFENLSLEDAIKDDEDIQKIIPEIGFEYDIPKIMAEIKALKEILQKYNDIADDCGKVVSRLVTDWRRRRSIDRDLLLKIRKLIEMYSLMNDYNNPQNEVFMYLTAQEEMNLSDFLKTVKNYDAENTPVVIENLKNYYTIIKKRLEKVLVLLDKIEGDIEL